MSQCTVLSISRFLAVVLTEFQPPILPSTTTTPPNPILSGHGRELLNLGVKVLNLGSIEVLGELGTRVVDAEAGVVVGGLAGRSGTLGIGKSHGVAGRVDAGVIPSADALGERVEGPVGAVVHGAGQNGVRGTGVGLGVGAGAIRGLLVSYLLKNFEGQKKIKK